MTKSLDHPVIPAFVFIDTGADGHGSFVLAFWCPFCRKVHCHDHHSGAFLTGHCFQDNPTSPLCESGYILRVAGYITSLDDLVPVSERLKKHEGFK